jgi:polyisoprenoid-binding protein YceI
MTKTTWTIDPTHSEVGFKIKHLMITNVKGHFKQYEAHVESDHADKFHDASIRFEANIGSIDTGNEQRDGHLKSPDFFDAEKFPKLTFVSTKTESKGSDGMYEVHGNLNMHGVSKPVILEAEFSGIAKDLYGNIKAGFNISGKLSRKDFGLTWNAPTEAGGVVVSDEVKIHAEIQLIKQA